ncbi:HTH domain-containing protein [Cohnella faecalis]|uniref:HTH domain-containing protein n=1 Tax=Cohnella faecalis TaxID=2315694 RepID=UPI0013141EE1
MLSLLWLLTSNEKMTAERLADKMEVSVRTIYRYVEVPYIRRDVWSRAHQWDEVPYIRREVRSNAH